MWSCEEREPDHEPSARAKGAGWGAKTTADPSYRQEVLADSRATLREASGLIRELGGPGGEGLESESVRPGDDTDRGRALTRVSDLLRDIRSGLDRINRSPASQGLSME
jgi:hypothetical protein